MNIILRIASVFFWIAVIVLFLYSPLLHKLWQPAPSLSIMTWADLLDEGLIQQFEDLLIPINEQSLNLLKVENITLYNQYYKKLESFLKNNRDRSSLLKKINKIVNASISLENEKVLESGLLKSKDALYRLFLTCNTLGIKIKDLKGHCNPLIKKLIECCKKYNNKDVNVELLDLFTKTDCNVNYIEKDSDFSEELLNFQNQVIVSTIEAEKHITKEKSRQECLYAGVTLPSSFTIPYFNRYFKLSSEISLQDKRFQISTFLGSKDALYKLFTACNKHKIFIKDINAYVIPLLQAIIENSSEPEKEFHQLFENSDFDPNIMGLPFGDKGYQQSHFNTVLYLLSVQPQVSNPIEIFPTIKLFLEKGADLNSKSLSPKNGIAGTPFGYIIANLTEPQNSLVKDCTFSKEKSFLASNKNKELMNLLFQYKADPNIQIEDSHQEEAIGATPFHFATYTNSPYINIFLNNGANPNIEKKSGETPLDGYLSYCKTNLDNLKIFKEKVKDVALLKKISTLENEFLVLDIHKALNNDTFEEIPTLLQKIGIGNIQEKPDGKGSSLLNKALTYHARACNQKQQAQYNTNELDIKIKKLENIIDLFIKYKANPYFYTPEGMLPYEYTNDSKIRNKLLDALYNFIYKKEVQPIMNFLNFGFEMRALQTKSLEVETFLLCLKRKKLIVPKYIKNNISKRAFFKYFVPKKFNELSVQGIENEINQDMQKFKEAIEGAKSSSNGQDHWGNFRKNEAHQAIASLFVKWDIYNPETKRTEIK